ncbi:MAG: hypothetical protein OHK0013_09390 [Sandaracinaceae bacterium]
MVASAALFVSAEAHAHPTPEQARELEVELRGMTSYFDERTGLTLDPASVHVLDDRMPVSDVVRAAAIPDNPRLLGLAMPVRRVDEDSEWVYTNHGPDCLIVFTDRGLGASGTARTALLAHELFHCYQFRAAAPLSLLDEYPAWLIEGAAEYAGDVYAAESGNVAGWARAFFSLSNGFHTLFAMRYEGLLVFGHLAEQGIEPERHALSVLVATSDLTRTERAYQTIEMTLPLGSTLSASWATGLWREPERGPRWNLRLPLGVSVGATISQGILAEDVAETIRPAGVIHRILPLRPNRLYWFRTDQVVGGVSGVGLGGERIDDPLGPGFTGPYCYSPDGPCRCADGREIAETHTVSSVDHLEIAAFSGPRRRGSLTVVTTSPACCDGSGLDPRLVGTWELDLPSYAALFDENTAPAVCTAHAEGTHTMRIDANGGVSRWTSALVTRQTCEVNRMVRESTWTTDGATTACVQVLESAGGPVLAWNFRSHAHWTTATPGISGAPGGSEFHLDGAYREPANLAGWPAAERAGVPVRAPFVFEDDDTLVLRPGDGRGARRYRRRSR